MKSCCELLMQASDVHRVQFLEPAHIVRVFNFDWPPSCCSDKRQMPSDMHSLLFIHKMGLLFFFCSFFLHLMHSRYKDKHVLNHKLNSSSLILLPISKCPPPPKKATLYVCIPVSHSERSSYSNLVLAEWHTAPSEYFHFFIYFFWQITHSPFKQIALFL